MVAKKLLSYAAKTILVSTDFSSCEPLKKRSCLQSAFLAGSFSFIFWTCIPYCRICTRVRRIRVDSTTFARRDRARVGAFFSGLPLEKVAWEKCTEEVQAAAAIAHKANHVQANMIVIGTHGPCSWAAWLKRWCVRHPALSLTIRPEPFQFELP